MTKGVPVEVLESIDAIVGYLWDDEEADYEVEDKPEGHVFEHLKRVNTWLEQAMGLTDIKRGDTT